MVEWYQSSSSSKKHSQFSSQNSSHSQQAGQQLSHFLQQFMYAQLTKIIIAVSRQHPQNTMSKMVKTTNQNVKQPRRSHPAPSRLYHSCPERQAPQQQPLSSSSSLVASLEEVLPRKEFSNLAAWRYSNKHALSNNSSIWLKLMYSIRADV